MNKINIHDAKTNLSKYISKLKRGEIIILCRRNLPIAEIRLLENDVKAKRKIGLAKNLFVVPEAFFEPLPTDIIEVFQGEKELS